ncbi:hypothetical protein ACFQZE_14870 [Paenibacillus sp. GCM10027627]|uniref:hypothetical protein n=1 Tax=unclassified Paenibacillus TaxID=185978 RepID=UPI0036334C1E
MTMLMVLVLSLGGSVFANGSFTASTVNLGKGANGSYQVKVSWTVPTVPSGVSVSHYNVKRHDMIYPWFQHDVCQNVTSTTCTDATPFLKAVYEYYVTAVLTNGTQIHAPKSSITLKDYLGPPAVPTVVVTHVGGGMYKQGFSIASGNNADYWYLYSNGVCINCGLLQHNLQENGTNPQSAYTQYVLPSGTYTYQVKLTNIYGSTWSAPYTVVVP